MVKYILHFLKQEHVSSAPDSSLSGTLHRHSDTSKNKCPKLPGQDRIFYPPFTLYTRCTGTQSQEVTDHSTDSVLAGFSGRCYLYWRGTGNRAMPFSPVWILDVAHRDCLLVQAEGSEGLYCDRRKVVHGPGALPWVVIFNVNCHKIWAITSLVSWIYYQHPALAIDLKVVLLYITMMWSELLLIASSNDIAASWAIWLWPDCWCKGRRRSWRLHRVCGPQGRSCCWSHAAGIWEALGFLIPHEPAGLRETFCFPSSPASLPLPGIFLSAFLVVSLQSSYTGLCCLHYW